MRSCLLSCQHFQRVKNLFLNFTLFEFQTHKQPVTEYEAIREKAANQKKDVEKALTRFLAKTSDTHNLFDVDDNQMFPRKCFEV